MMRYASFEAALFSCASFDGILTGGWADSVSAKSKLSQNDDRTAVRDDQHEFYRLGARKIQNVLSERFPLWNLILGSGIWDLEGKKKRVTAPSMYTFTKNPSTFQISMPRW